MTHFHWDAPKLTTSSLYLSRAIWRFAMVSCASKQANTQVLWIEFGELVFTIWKFILNAPPPLSPPSLIHTSVSGITPLCHVRVAALFRGINCADQTAKMYYTLPFIFIYKFGYFLYEARGISIGSSSYFILTRSAGETERCNFCFQILPNHFFGYKTQLLFTC